MLFRSITVTPSGGISPYTYQWSNGATTATTTGLHPGTYTVTVTSSNGCTTTATYTIVNPATSLVLNSNKVNLRCGGTSSGSCSVSPVGGSSPYSYLWNNGQTTSSVTGLAAGTYTVTVTDDAGCTKTKTIVLTQNPVLIAFGTPLSPTSAEVSASGGVPPYSYLWKTTPSQTTSVATGLSPGLTYKVKVTDSKNCSIIVTVTTPTNKKSNDLVNDKFSAEVVPNPTSGLADVIITTNGVKEDVVICLFDMQGRKVMCKTEAILQQRNTFAYDWSQMQKGVYSLLVQSSNGNKVIRIIIE